MNKTYLIFKHEFLYTIKRTGFIIMTLTVPLLVLLSIGFGQLISALTKPPVIEIKTVGYVDETGKFNSFTAQGNIKLVSFNNRDEAVQALIKNDVSEYFIVPADYLKDGIIHRFTLEKEIDTPPEVRALIKNFITGNLLAGKISPDIVNLIESPLNFKVTRLAKTGIADIKQSGIGNIIIPGISAFYLPFPLCSFQAT